MKSKFYLNNYLNLKMYFSNARYIELELCKMFLLIFVYIYLYMYRYIIIKCVSKIRNIYLSLTQ